MVIGESSIILKTTTTIGFTLIAHKSEFRQKYLRESKNQTTDMCVVVQ